MLDSFSNNVKLWMPEIPDNSLKSYHGKHFSNLEVACFYFEYPMIIGFDVHREIQRVITLLCTIQGAALLFILTAALVIGLCIVIVVKVKRARKNRLVNADVELAGDIWPEPRTARWGSVKRVLMKSVRWSNASKWEESRSSASRREKVRPLLVSTGLAERGIGWQRRCDLVSPVWQRPILMGEKCELPRFSGLILYDESGRPLEEHSVKGTPDHDNEDHIVVTRTLRDLL
ncbi:Transmembrane protein [Heracleum sosnowskyi]|uniref:Transmembrane protein n=1 Tax=Heracleum sosnowskyi TaxID=360622 RepID=A0AAD8JGD3_9APIA|nr:Transmembrane protein [Heracleum sosnowskyi]